MSVEQCMDIVLHPPRERTGGARSPDGNGAVTTRRRLGMFDSWYAPRGALLPEPAAPVAERTNCADHLTVRGDTSTGPASTASFAATRSSRSAADCRSLISDTYD